MIFKRVKQLHFFAIRGPPKTINNEGMCLLQINGEFWLEFNYNTLRLKSLITTLAESIIGNCFTYISTSFIMNEK